MMKKKHFICPECANLLTRRWDKCWCVGHEGSYSMSEPKTTGNAVEMVVIPDESIVAYQRWAKVMTFE